MDSTNNNADRPLGMRRAEIEQLRILIHQFGCRRILEVGMANASSTVMFLHTLQEIGGGEVVSIDPFQYRDEPGVDEVYSIRGVGMENVRKSGLANMHRLINDYDYVALPQLVSGKQKFDLVFIDGYHSFDYTFVDFFYA